MDREKLQSFIRTAENDLASIRGSLLILSQDGDMSDIAAPGRLIARLRDAAMHNSLPAIASQAAECEEAVRQLASPGDAYKILDIVASIEASLLAIPLQSDEFLSDVSGFVDSSFDGIASRNGAHNEVFSGFEIDEETLEIFRAEAEELLANISNGLRILALLPSDQNALWEIRRNAHTLKGAAGIVGLAEAAETAHRMEDLLDKLVETKRDAAQPVLSFLEISAKKLTAIVDAKQFDDEPSLTSQYLAAVDALGTDTGASAPIARTSESEITEIVNNARPTTKPIVRVSLDRLDDLLETSRELTANRETIGEALAEVLAQSPTDKVAVSKLESLFETAYRLHDELNEKLLRIRMVKFGTLETRLSRAVNVTCMDVGKKAVFELENGGIEIDTLIMDSIVEPLLHLLKNAVVHGIESPETRRLLGKPERGTIHVNVELDDDIVLISVADDGAGVSVQKLKVKALTNGLIDRERAEALTDKEAFELMFDQGLTTAEKVDLNAGRGVGMSIVKESIESRGGSVKIESSLQRGTKFTIQLPVTSLQSKSEPKPYLQNLEEDEIPTIMVVDDSPSMRHKTQKLVESCGFKCIAANSGADALELLLNGTHEPDLILSDVEMPQIDGWEFLEYMKTDENLGHIPIVLVTSLDADEHRQHAFDLGAADYIVKPLTSDLLAKVVEKTLNCAIA